MRLAPVVIVVVWAYGYTRRSREGRTLRTLGGMKFPARDGDEERAARAFR